MKGTPDIPQCGFSRRVVAILDSLGACAAPSSMRSSLDTDLSEPVRCAGVDYDTCNVLEDEEIRASIKTFSYVRCCVLWRTKLAAHRCSSCTIACACAATGPRSLSCTLPASSLAAATLSRKSTSPGT